jgi:hypothetical protein
VRNQKQFGFEYCLEKHAVDNPTGVDVALVAPSLHGYQGSLHHRQSAGVPGGIGGMPLGTLSSTNSSSGIYPLLQVDIK